MLRKCPWFQAAHIPYLYFGFTGLLHKNTIMVYWLNNLVAVVLSIITLLALTA